MVDENIIRKYYELLPNSMKSFVISMYQNMPFTKRNIRNKWIKNTYSQFGQDQRKYLFLSMARFMHINRPIEGYYFEFGCHEANTMRMAWDNFNHLFDFDYVAFDSFEGLPEIEEIDEQLIWEKGKLKTEVENFRKIVSSNGMPQDKLTTIKGFYEDSLTKELKEKLISKKAAVIYIDVDLYHSTIPVLNFIKDFLQIGTIIVFDDWNCFYGDPQKGERKAFKEFCEKNSDLKFEKFVNTNEAQCFIYTGLRD